MWRRMCATLKMQDSPSNMDNHSLVEFDKKHIWHPYASATHAIEPLLVKEAHGVYLELANDAKLIDGMSSWWSVIHGYNHPDLNKAMQEQAQKMSHVMFGGLTHQPAIDLAQNLLNIAPEGLEHIFYCDSGSVAVEVAMKMALQYWHAKGLNHKNQFVTIKNGYHGDTWHAMSVCDPVTGMHHIFNNKLAIQYFLPAPESKFDEPFKAEEIEKVEDLLKSEHKNVAAFILEPIVQGAGGMRFYHPEYLVQVKQLCEKYNILLVADEIATGFGRTGELFACNYAQITPDIMCLGKAITGGYMSFAATLCSAEIATVISQNDPKVFMHGPTFMANPLACAVANESIKILLNSNWQQNIQRIEKHLKKQLSKLSEIDEVADVRVLGAIGVVEMKQAVDMKVLQEYFTKHGIWMRPFGKLVYTMPPYIISDAELEKLTNGICKTIETVYA